MGNWIYTCSHDRISLTDWIDVLVFPGFFFFIDQEKELFYFSASGTTRKKSVRIEGVYFSYIISNRYQWNPDPIVPLQLLAVVIDTQLKEWDKIISENSSLIPFVRYSVKNNFVHK